MVDMLWALLAVCRQHTHYFVDTARTKHANVENYGTYDANVIIFRLQNKSTNIITSNWHSHAHIGQHLYLFATVLRKPHGYINY